jgi:hypothetical protein
MKRKNKKIVWGRSPVEQLYKATVRYIEKNGGSALVVGGIAIVQEGGDERRYGIIVEVFGKKPIMPNPELLTPKGR